MQLRQKTLKCASKLCLEAIKVVLVGVLLISRTRPFLSITDIINDCCIKTQSLVFRQKTKFVVRTFVELEN